MANIGPYIDVYRDVTGQDFPKDENIRAILGTYASWHNEDGALANWRAFVEWKGPLREIRKKPNGLPFYEGAHPTVWHREYHEMRLRLKERAIRQGERGSADMPSHIAAELEKTLRKAQGKDAPSS